MIKITPLIALVIGSTMISCRSKSNSPESSPPPQTNQTGTSNTDDGSQDIANASMLPISYRGLPAGQKSVLNNANGVIGDTTLTCAKSGFGVGIYRSKIDGDIPASICCINISLEQLSADSNFTKREGDTYKVTPKQCDVAIISSTEGKSFAEKLEIDLRSQRIVLFGNGDELTKQKSTVLTGHHQGGFVLANGRQKLTPIALRGNVGLKKLKFLNDAVQYTHSSDSDALDMEDVDMLKGGLSLADWTSSLPGQRSTKFSNVRVFTQAAGVPVVLIEYPFNTQGITIIPHSMQPAHIGFGGSFKAVTAELTSNYPVVTNIEVKKGASLSVAAGTTLWSKIDTKAYDPNSTLFKIREGASVSIVGQADKPIQIAGFKRIDGGLPSFQSLAYVENQAKLTLTHAIVNSSPIDTVKGAEVNLSNVELNYEKAAPHFSITSGTQILDAKIFFRMNGGRLTVQGPVKASLSEPTQHFAFVTCGLVSGMDSVTVNGVGSSNHENLIVTKLDNNAHATSDCVKILLNDKKQAVHHKMVVIRDGEKFRPMTSCRLLSRNRSKTAEFDCFGLVNPNFSKASLVSNGFTYWSGEVVVNNQAFSGGSWNGSSSPRAIAPNGSVVNSFPADQVVKLVIEETDLHTGFEVVGN